MGEVSRESIEHHINELAKVGFNPSSGGFTRLAYTERKLLLTTTLRKLLQALDLLRTGTLHPIFIFTILAGLVMI